jgi:O-antigen/teichoic acid export membrane protein
MRRCIAYALFFGLSATAVLLLCAEPIGFLWVRDARTVLALRLYAPCLPSIALSSVLAGYFVATGRVYKAAAAQLIEQLCERSRDDVLGLAPRG